MAQRKKAPARETVSKPKAETEHSPGGMKKVGIAVHVAGLERPIHFPLGCQWRWFYASIKPLLQVVDGEHIVAEIHAASVIAVYGPAWVSPVQRSPERP